MVRSGYIELYNSIIANSQGTMFVIDLLQGAKARIVESTFGYNQVAAVVRVSQSSLLEVTQSLSPYDEAGRQNSDHEVQFGEVG